jgi:hypothetical protein
MAFQKLTLTRGSPIEHVPQDSLRLSCAPGPLKDRQKEAYLHLHLQVGAQGPTLTGETRLCHGDIVAFEQGYWVNLGDLGLDVYFGVLPWWQFPDFPLPEKRRVLYVPMRGWWQGQWHDGPLAHYVAEGYLASFVPPGADARLTIPWETSPPSPEVIPYIRQTFVNESLKWLALRTSAAFGLRDWLVSQIGEHNRIQVAADQWDQQTAVLLCLLRLGFPDESFEMAVLPTQKDRSPLWKRLCQNLDIICGKAPRPVAKATDLELGDLRQLVPDETVEPLITAINRQSPLIPDRLQSA